MKQNWRKEKRAFKRKLKTEWSGGCKAFKLQMTPKPGENMPAARRACNWL